MNAEQPNQQWGQIVAKAWANEGFKGRLLANPGVVLQEEGMVILAGFQVKVVEDTDKVLHLTLPAKPGQGELSEEDLDRVAGGFCCGGKCVVATPPKHGPNNPETIIEKARAML